MDDETERSSEFMDQFRDLQDEEIEWLDGEWEMHAHEAGCALRSSDDHRDFAQAMDFARATGATKWLPYLTLNSNLNVDEREELLELVDWIADSEHEDGVVPDTSQLADILDGYEGLHNPALMEFFDEVVSGIPDPTEDIEATHRKVMTEWAIAKPILLADLINDYEGAKASGHRKDAGNLLKQIRPFVDAAGFQLIVNNRRAQKLPPKWLAHILVG